MRACTSSSTGIATWSLKVRRPGARAAAMQAKPRRTGPPSREGTPTSCHCRYGAQMQMRRIRHRRAPSNRSSLSRGSATSVLEVLAERRGRDLEAQGISVVAMGGSKNVTRFLKMFGPQGLDVRLAGLCDAAEEGDFRRGLEGRPRIRPHARRSGTARLLRVRRRSRGRADPFTRRRCRGTSRHRAGDLVSFRTFQRQPEWRGRSVEEQLRASSARTAAGRSGRPPPSSRHWISTRVPRPLDQVLAHV